MLSKSLPAMLDVPGFVKLAHFFYKIFPEIVTIFPTLFKNRSGSNVSHALLSLGISRLLAGLLTLWELWKKEGMYGMTEIRGLDLGLSNRRGMEMRTSSWSHTWKAFGWEWLRAAGAAG